MTLAYLDPGSGSLIISAMVGGAAAAGVAVKQARSKVTGAFRRKPKPGTVTTETFEPTEPAMATDTPAEAAAPGDNA